jgi:hypothetical protein
VCVCVTVRWNHENDKRAHIPVAVGLCVLCVCVSVYVCAMCMCACVYMVYVTCAHTCCCGSVAWSACHCSSCKSCSICSARCCCWTCDVRRQNKSTQEEWAGISSGNFMPQCSCDNWSVCSARCCCWTCKVRTQNKSTQEEWSWISIAKAYTLKKWPCLLQLQERVQKPACADAAVIALNVTNHCYWFFLHSNYSCKKEC